MLSFVLYSCILLKLFVKYWQKIKWIIFLFQILMNVQRAMVAARMRAPIHQAVTGARVRKLGTNFM